MQQSCLTNAEGNQPGHSSGGVQQPVIFKPNQCLEWKHTCCLPEREFSYNTAQVCLTLHSTHASGTDAYCFVCYEGLLTCLKCQGHVTYCAVLACFAIVLHVLPSCITHGTSGRKIALNVFGIKECITLTLRTFTEVQLKRK